MGKVADLLNTAKGQRIGEEEGKRLADATFRFLIQMDFVMAAAGLTNKVLLPMNWSSPKYWVNAASLAQYEIIASRIVLECFFDLLYIIDTGHRMSGKSKFRVFRSWVLKPNNPFKYFLGHIVHAFQSDRKHRQLEVHGTSRFVHLILRLQEPDFKELNIPLELASVLLNVWGPLLFIMDGIRPTSLSTFSSWREFAEKYFASAQDSTNLDSFLSDVLKSF